MVIGSQHSLHWGFKRLSERTSRSMTVWPSGLRRWLQAPVRKGVGSNPTAVSFAGAAYAHVTASMHSSQLSHDARVAPTVLGPPSC